MMEDDFSTSYNRLSRGHEKNRQNPLSLSTVAPLQSLSGDGIILTSMNPLMTEKSQNQNEDVVTLKLGSVTDYSFSPSVISQKDISMNSSNKPLEFAVWAHYMTFASAFSCFILGLFGILFENATTYKCSINDEIISSKYMLDANQTCSSAYVHDGASHYICCNPSSTSDLKGNWIIGTIYLFYSLFLVVFESVDYGYGLWYQKETKFHRYGISPLAMSHFVFGVIGLISYITCLAGIFLLSNAVVLQYAMMRGECGDGGRGLSKEKKVLMLSSLYNLAPSFKQILNPFRLVERLYNEDKVSTYFWVFVFYACNFIIFAYTLNHWNGTVMALEQQLLDGTLDISCNSKACKLNRKMVRYGPISRFAPWAKACGGCLNFDCALLLLPITKSLLAKLNNSGVSFSKFQHNAALLTKFLARPLTRYIPLQKNIQFHQLCAQTILFFAIAHIVFHYLNLIPSNAATMQLFRQWGWEGSAYFTGSIITFSMFIIYTSAINEVKRIKYEMFFTSHQFFAVFYIGMFLHGPIFFYFGTIPVILYLVERYVQSQQGKTPFVINKIDWISPVLAIYFRPVIKQDFNFKEGQYLYLNCPYISLTEWHPFTISSASDDMNFGPRVHIATGIEVIEVPRPLNLDPHAKWSKYCFIHQDYRKLHFNDLLDKGDTTYNDYISLHIRVHGLDDPYALTWTRRLKEYFELMNPAGNFPLYFNHRDARGDISIGRLVGPDGQQILRVHGPHSAPAEHYVNYGTVMIIGAGIGLTPCASILSSLLRYRWRKDHKPEILHFYWIIRQSEIDSFQWFIYVLTDLSYELKKDRESHQIEDRYYCEINIYITGVSSSEIPHSGLKAPSKTLHENSIQPPFHAAQLYELMLNPKVDSKGQIEKMKSAQASNRLGDIFVWNGRPYWDDIFRELSMQRQHTDIGVCFCGSAAIGSDLRTMCNKYSSAKDDCLFSLHKENF